MKRQGPQGMMLDYVPWSYVAERLNEAFPGCWSYEFVGDPKIQDGMVMVKVRLTTPLGQQEAYGSHAYDPKNNRNASPSDSIQSAGHKALRRAASHWGIALDLYGGESEEVDEDVLGAKAALNNAIKVYGLNGDDILTKLSDHYGQGFNTPYEAIEWMINIDGVREEMAYWKIIELAIGL